MRHIWNGKKLTIQNKFRTLTVCVFNILLYALETRTLKEIDKKKPLTLEMCCYRRILKISWKDMVKTEDIRKTIAREETIIDTRKKRKLSLLGLICRMNDNRLTKRTVFTKIDGKPGRSRLCREWLNDIKD